jgi:transposase
VLRALPEGAYEYAVWAPPKANIDYHVEFDHHYYSVPYTLAGQKLDLRATATTIEVFRDGRRVASHRRSYVAHKATTVPEHMASAHRAHAEWTPSRIAAWAAKIGPKTAELVSEIMRRKPHPEQGFRASLGVIRLRSRYPDDRIERACARALAHRAISYRSVEAILRHHLDRVADDGAQTPSLLPRHGNIRGADYYH